MVCNGCGRLFRKFGPLTVNVRRRSSVRISGCHGDHNCGNAVVIVVITVAMGTKTHCAGQ